MKGEKTTLYRMYIDKNAVANNWFKEKKVWLKLKETDKMENNSDVNKILFWNLMKGLHKEPSEK